MTFMNGLTAHLGAGCVAFGAGLLWLQAFFVRPVTGPWAAPQSRTGNKQ